jgi:heterodisulfide reductase subunit A-like polyferredoxin
MIPSEGTRELAEMLGLEVDPHGWWVEQEANLAPLDTSRPGIWLAGAGTGPKDIPEAVSQGSGAAGKVLSLLSRWGGPPGEMASHLEEGLDATDGLEGSVDQSHGEPRVSRLRREHA